MLDTKARGERAASQVNETKQKLPQRYVGGSEKRKRYVIMKTASGNIWEIPATAKVIPTNGIVTSRGLAVMGAGVAKQAATKIPILPALLGSRILRFGNRLYMIELEDSERVCVNSKYLITLPTKQDWRDSAELPLLIRGVRQLVEITQAMGLQTILLPEIGMGLGGLPKNIVYPVLEKYLDDRCTIVQYAKGKAYE